MTPQTTVEKAAAEYGEKHKVLRGQFVGTADRLAMAFLAGAEWASQRDKEDAFQMIDRLFPGVVLVPASKASEIKAERDSLKAQVEELKEKLKSTESPRNCGHPGGAGFGTYCAMCERDYLEAQLEEARKDFASCHETLWKQTSSGMDVIKDCDFFKAQLAKAAEALAATRKRLVQYSGWECECEELTQETKCAQCLSLHVLADLDATKGVVK